MVAGDLGVPGRAIGDASKARFHLLFATSTHFSAPPSPLGLGLLWKGPASCRRLATSIPFHQAAI